MNENIHGEVKSYYGNIAKKVVTESQTSCCTSNSCGCGESDNSYVYDSKYLVDLPAEAIKASLGCANPISIANLQKGEVVLDLGSGGGIDVLISSKIVGEEGKAYGLDMTDEMLSLANENKKKSGIQNVEFIKGFIENIPLEKESVDVVISNCVINLTESKEKALKETYRVLKRGGRLAIADVVQLKPVPEIIKQNAQMWVGCIAGAMTIDVYTEILRKVGFSNIEIIPVNIYTKEVLKTSAENKNLVAEYLKIDENDLDGAFAGAQVKAYKD